jgi:dTDP-4-amino-4,6-dideoxygalactose transaminase
LHEIQIKKMNSRSPIPLLDLQSQYSTISEEVDAAVARVFEAQQFILGPEVDNLETEVAAYCDCEAGIGVSSGTDALLLSMMAIGIQPGDEIITTPYSFFSAVGSIWRMGARPVFVDINPRTFNMGTETIQAALTDRTRAILPVHLYGQMVDMDPIMSLAEENDLVVIEDAAQAIGAEYKGRRAGSIGHLGCFSFFPSKNLGGAGDGGMVVTNRPELADRVRLLRNHGQGPKYYHPAVGGNFRLDALQAAILSVKLKYLPEWTEVRRRNAEMYTNFFGAIGVGRPGGTREGADLTEKSSNLQMAAVQLPSESDHCRHVYNQFVIRVIDLDDRPGAQGVGVDSVSISRSANQLVSPHGPNASSPRNALVMHLKELKIGCEVYYPIPLHLQECFLSLGYKAGDFPNAEEAAEQTIALPVYPELESSQLKRIVSAIADWSAEVG